MTDETTVLVADDDAEFRELLVEFLEDEGFRVAEAANGLETLLHVKHHRPRFVVLDVHMPRLGGLDALRRIQAFDRSIGVVIVTGMADDELKRQAQALGAVAFFTKPPDLAALSAALGLPSGTAPVPARSVGAMLGAALPSSAPKAMTSPGATTPMPEPARILIVDDEAEVRGVLAELLEGAGYQVQTAADGGAAVRAVVMAAPDLVLLDIEMPGLGGVEALATIRAVAPAVRVVMLSGITDVEVARRTLAYGAFEYIPKPFDPAHLLATVETVLAYRALDAETT